MLINKSLSIYILHRGQCGRSPFAVFLPYHSLAYTRVGDHILVFVNKSLSIYTLHCGQFYQQKEWASSVGTATLLPTFHMIEPEAFAPISLVTEAFIGLGCTCTKNLEFAVVTKLNVSDPIH